MFYTTDCHNDTIANVTHNEGKLINNYNVSNKTPFAQIFAMFCDFNAPTFEDSLSERFNIANNDFWGLLKGYICEYHNQTTMLGISDCRTLSQVKKAYENGENIGLLGVEGAGSINTIDKLHYVYEHGCRFITLTWNQSNCIGSGCSTTGTDNDTGLTDYGKEFVKECENLGIFIDLSHASVKLMHDVLDSGNSRVFASHSNFRAVCDHPRNLPDDVAKEICKRGGYIGLNTYLPFVVANTDYPQYDPAKLVDHAEYADKLGLLDNLGFGFDLDGIDGYGVGIDGEKSIHDQYLPIFEKKFNKEQIEKIWYKNFFNFLDRKLK